MSALTKFSVTGVAAFSAGPCSRVLAGAWAWAVAGVVTAAAVNRVRASVSFELWVMLIRSK